MVGFALTFNCMVLTALISALSMQQLLSVLDRHGRGEVPAARLAGDLQRKMLNARASLVHHMTIQRPGARELELQPLKVADATLDQLVSFINSQGELTDLNPGVELLYEELKSSESERGKSLLLVDSGVVAGLAYAVRLGNRADERRSAERYPSRPSLSVVRG